MKGFKVKLQHHNFGELMHPVPYSLKDRIIKKFYQLERKDIKKKKRKKKAEYSRWAAPVILIPKGNSGIIQLCQNYKQAINRFLRTTFDKYPIPCTGDLFATLKRGEKFNRLDLCHEY